MVRKIIEPVQKFLPGAAALVIVIAMYLPYSTRINFFGLQVLDSFVHTWEGSLATVILLMYQALILKDSMSRPWWVVLFILVVLFGCFQAWERAYLSMLGREADLHAAEGNWNKEKTRADALQKEKDEQVKGGSAAVRPAHIVLLYQSAKLDGQDIKGLTLDSPTVQIGQIGMLNDGGKKTEAVPTVRMQFSEVVIAQSGGNSGWQITPVSEMGFKSAAFWSNGSAIPVSAGDQWFTNQFIGNLQVLPPATVMHVRVRVFYGGALPAIANFTVSRP